ncbi:Lsr2 family DNA-binding protein [Arthrobacter sp. YAF16]|uniref:Lsr2 family DNA-binding protein n=1 Tax=Arthrobacter sp. YAF16 TaxID=3233076 RepID=UPI003F8E44F0
MKPRSIRSDRGYKDHEKYVNRTIRDWAGQNGVKVSDRGAIPKAVRTAWIEAHKDLNNPVIWHSILQDPSTGVWYRAVEVLCYRCASIHQHGGEVGTRPAPESNHRVPHCSGDYADQPGGYFIEDTLPVDENEQAMAAENAALAIS